mmetsp:Transcript_39707/g.98261  ORF Transcript_39707/g.98261 Transcript_39707/m.98261 type:complete len:362 (-) Transcript_39707:259-1344(-)|eukprot:CAMPEP_0197578312 /NCGR_PEP_ID=MMETSP1326-20131121/2580_1 /TAXON_ID=1155430 /ORGANISM="Genus nov. species nov., Strain RCC2288" /LENGTH=361 /DNA_ID=CAMNT_0043141481 /DNA_START=123 /DNA_END=1208 /DNA_ORIENTATION=+
MAKVGEGDERWIVAEREDGSNVNGWHWQEKDAFEWSRERFGDLLMQTVCEGEPDGVFLRTTGVSALTGEAYVNRRKGKIIAGYELDLKISYEGEIREGGAADGAVTASVTGNVHFPYLADENAGDEPDAKVLAAGEGPNDEKIKEIMRRVGLPKLYKGVATFEKEMAAGGPGGEGAAPTKAAAAKTGGGDFRDTAKAADSKEVKSNKAAETDSRSDKTAPLSRKAHTIKMTERFFCRPQDICDALLDGGRVQHFSRSPASVRPEPGPFTMFDGNIHGETLEYEPGKKIVQNWRFRNWAEGHFSRVTITFREPEPGNCFVDLVQENVPETDGFGNESVMDTTESGWKEQIFDRIRKVFGYGA